MRTVGLAAALAIGLLVGLVWTREPAPSSPVRNAPVQPSARPERTVTLPSVQRALLAQPARERSELRPTTDPLDPRHEVQAKLWSDLKAFEHDARLEDAQWKRFENDLSELASIEFAAFSDAVRNGGFEDLLALNAELERELIARCAEYMTARQLALLRKHFIGALITRIRWAHYLPEPV